MHFVKPAKTAFNKALPLHLDDDLKAENQVDSAKENRSELEAVNQITHKKHQKEKDEATVKQNDFSQVLQAAINSAKVLAKDNLHLDVIVPHYRLP